MEEWIKVIAPVIAPLVGIAALWWKLATSMATKKDISELRADMYRADDKLHADMGNLEDRLFTEMSKLNDKGWTNSTTGWTNSTTGTNSATGWMGFMMHTMQT